MTVSQVGYKKEYVGLAADTKPVIDAIGGSIPAGSEFKELDTSKLYIWDGTTWRFFYTFTSTS